MTYDFARMCLRKNEYILTMAHHLAESEHVSMQEAIDATVTAYLDPWGDSGVPYEIVVLRRERAANRPLLGFALPIQEARVRLVDRQF